MITAASIRPIQVETACISSGNDVEFTAIKFAAFDNRRSDCCCPDIGGPNIAGQFDRICQTVCLVRFGISGIGGVISVGSKRVGIVRLDIRRRGKRISRVVVQILIGHLCPVDRTASAHGDVAVDGDNACGTDGERGRAGVLVPDSQPIQVEIVRGELTPGHHAVSVAIQKIGSLHNALEVPAGRHELAAKRSFCAGQSPRKGASSGV